MRNERGSFRRMVDALGVTRQNAAYYTVHVSIQDTSRALLGGSASVYLLKK